ncbi:MAG TPA: sugar ABC transporter permease [Reyranella sp.]|jgi:multiple sugar transport system permease protein|nr:sugar ABC transporter permease [Reyranella sp.]
MVDVAAAPRAPVTPRRRRDWTPELLSLPALVAILAVMGFPLLYLGWMSLHRWSLVGFDPPRFVGLANFTQLVQDERFVEALGRTFWFTALGLVSNLPLGLGIALLMHERFPGRSLCRALLILPMVATPAAMGLVWVIMLDPTLGIVRYLLGAIGIDHPPLWLSDPDLVVPTLVAVDAWMWTPMVALICIAGLAALPPEPFEAALVDGASALQRFRYLTLPMMLPTLMVAAMLRVMDLLKLIDIVYVMTGGGPGHLSETINLYNYLAALSYDKIGYGSAIALVLFAIVIACTLVLIRLRRPAS